MPQHRTAKEHPTKATVDSFSVVLRGLPQRIENGAVVRTERAL
ncbi:hypothetical protein [Mycobacterium sp. E2479]|nr:hypothetical protein [Mycobacterium sp. E2479]